MLIAHAARTRPLVAGSIIGSGTVSNKLDGGPGKPVDAGGVGYSCIAEIRTIETIENGKGNDSLHALRRHGAHRDEGQSRPFHLRCHRAGRREIRKGLEAHGQENSHPPGDMADKKISFTEIGKDLWAFTAEGDPNTGVSIGDDSVMVRRPSCKL